MSKLQLADELPAAQNAYDYEDLLAVRSRRLFGPTNGRLPPNMLMLDRIALITTMTAASTARADPGRTRYQARPVVLRLPLRGRPGHAGVPGTRRDVAARRLPPRLAGLEGRGRALTVGKVKFTARCCRRRRKSATRSTSSASSRVNSTWRSPTARCRSTVAKSTRPRICASDCSPPPTTSQKSPHMRRAVITGIGAVSCIGNSKGEVTAGLARAGRSGIVANETFAEMGLRSQVSGSVDIDIAEHIDRKVRRFMGDAAAYAYIAMRDAIDDAGLGRQRRLEREAPG